MVNQARICTEFARQAAIESPSFHEQQIASYLKERFATLGANLIEDNAGARIGSQSNNLIFRLPGSKPGLPLMLSVHMDTVGPTAGLTPVLTDGVFHSGGDTILGADDKSGIAEIIEALEVVREEQIPHVPLEIVVTVCEEVGLLGAKHFDFSLLEARRGLALDTTGAEHVIHRAPAAKRLQVEITGKAAHAGVAPEKGISAIVIAAKAIAAMQLGRIDAETTANIGLLKAGQAVNIIPQHLSLEGEVRSHDPHKLAAQTRHMVECLEQEVNKVSIQVADEEIKASLKVDISDDYPAMHVPLDAEILQLVQQAATAARVPLQVKAAGGGSDANIYNAHGIETVIIGTGMNKVHSVEEEVKVADMVKIAGLLVEVIRAA